MNCNDYQRLLHLNRAGEISAQEAEDLRRHLRLCEKCTLAYQRIQRAYGFVARITSFSPSSRDPEKLTADILRRVRRESASPRQVDLLTGALDLFVQPAVRYATVTIVLLIISTFMFQLGATLNGISDLEQQMALVSGPKRNLSRPTYTAQSKTLEGVAKSRDVRSLTEVLPVTVRGGQIEVPVRDLESFAPIYDLRGVSIAIGSSALHIDRKTLEKIMNEVKASVAITLRFDREGK